MTNMNRTLFVRALATCLAGLLATGCASYGVRSPSGTGVTVLKSDEAGFVGGTGVESQDLVQVSDKMARSVLNSNSSRPDLLLVLPIPMWLSSKALIFF